MVQLLPYNKQSLICLIGPDGAGKTTLANILAQSISEHGFKVRVSWMRGTHTFAKIFAKFLSMFETFKGSDNPFHEISIPPTLRRFWQILEFISILPVFFVKYIFPQKIGFIVIGDRYLPDFVVWVTLTTHDKRYLHTFEARFLLSISSTINAKFYVKVNAEESFKRKKDMDPEFIREQIVLYDKISWLIGAHTLDTTFRSVEDCTKELLEILKFS
jgi:thymidylate kinase